jgi:hypothetical protein
MRKLFKGGMLMYEQRYVFYAHGTDYNAEPEESNIVIGYFTSLVLVKSAVEEYVRDHYEFNPENLLWSDQKGKCFDKPFLNLTATDDEKEGNFSIYIEVFPLDRRL